MKYPNFKLLKVGTLIIALCGLLTGMASAAPNNEAVCQQASDLIKDLGGRSIKTLTNSTDSLDKIENNFVVLLDEGFDIPSIARYVLPRYWKQSSAEQQQRFVTIFKSRLKKAYASRFREFRGVVFDVSGCRVEGDGGAVVTTSIQKPGGPVSKVDWKVYGKKIYDVTVEGISMSTTLRSDYGAMVQSKGGNIDAFLKSIE